MDIWDELPNMGGFTEGTYSFDLLQVFAYIQSLSCTFMELTFCYLKLINFKSITISKNQKHNKSLV